MSQQRYPYRGQMLSVPELARLAGCSSMNMAEPISRPRAGYVDFSIVPERHQEMHARLENWGRSCNGRARSNIAPLFQQYVPVRFGGDYGRDTVVPPDLEDARRVGLGVSHLPEPHRVALHWAYVQRTSVTRGRHLLACTTEFLHRLVSDGRTMLVNRGV